MKAKDGGPRVVVLLVLVGALSVSARTLWRQRTPLLRGESTWRLTYAASFHALKAGARLRAAFPQDTPSARVFRHELMHSGMNTERFRPSRLGTSEIVVVTPKSGQYHMAAEFDIHLSERSPWRFPAPEPALTAEARAAYLGEEKDIQTTSRPVVETLKRLLDEKLSRAALAERLFEHCLKNIRPGGDDAPRDAAAALQRGAASPAGRARALVALCRAGKLPARLVTGFEIKAGGNLPPQFWAEVLTNGRWEPFDPDNGYAHQLPRNFMPVRHDGKEVVRTTGVSDLATTFSIVRLTAPPGMVGSGRGHPADILDLTRLPVQVHEVLSLILLLPLGALAIAIFRTIVGVQTFGTFTPSLLALSFVSNDWRTGLVVFFAVMVVGLSSRTLLDRLKLLLVPRLSVILTLVVLCMVLAVSVLDYFGLTPSAQAVLLPMVILTMTIERFYVTTEEDSMKYALQLMAGTLALAFCVYLLLRWKAVGDMILVYPELHCFTVAALILVGRYSGYRLTELWRFRDVGG